MDGSIFHLIYSLILTSYFPHRWKDLCQYKLLILRTHRQFSGRVWLAYDPAFREYAAASNLVDWSSIDVQLYNFHPAGASSRRAAGCTDDAAEPPGANSSTVVCRSLLFALCLVPVCPQVFELLWAASSGFLLGSVFSVSPSSRSSRKTRRS